VNRRTAVLPVIVAALLGLAACTNSTTGNGTPAPPANTTQPGNSSPTSGGSGLTSIQPCDLLSSADVSQNQLGTPAPENLGGARTCSWQNTTANNGDGYNISVGIRDTQGINEISSGVDTITPDNIGSHPGRQLQSTQSGTCVIAIGVTNSSRVDVTVNAGTDPVQGCQLANQFAKLVEPNLPATSG
jgi:ABC-type phosphate transport system substrate-binding protein